MATSPKVQTILAAEVILLIILPLLPDAVLLFTDNFTFRTLLLIALLASSFGGPYVLLLTFIVVLAVFVLRNQAKMRAVKPEYPVEVLGSATKVQPTLLTYPESYPQPPALKPTETEYIWEPQEDMGNNTFAPVDVSINNKVVLTTEEPDGMGGSLFDPLKEYVEDTQSTLMA